MIVILFHSYMLSDTWKIIVFIYQMRKQAQRASVPKFTEQVKVNQNWNIQTPASQGCNFSSVHLRCCKISVRGVFGERRISIPSSDKWDLE